MPLETGTTYIRLKISDYDGTFEYSEVTQVYIKPEKKKRLPNPATIEQLKDYKSYNLDGTPIKGDSKGLVLVEIEGEFQKVIIR